MPSYAELAKLMDYASKNAAYHLVENLEEAGVLAKDNAGKIIPGSLFNELRVLGLVEAGFPTGAEEHTLDTMSLDEYLIPHKGSSYLLRVKGDSMKDAGIVEGDMVVVEKGASPKPGQIVVAEVDGGWTMKYYRVERGHIVLYPANDEYKPIRPTESLKISAVVRAVVRKY